MILLLRVLIINKLYENNFFMINVTMVMVKFKLSNSYHGYGELSNSESVTYKC